MYNISEETLRSLLLERLHQEESKSIIQKLREELGGRA
jgi:hypothetical protein